MAKRKRRKRRARKSKPQWGWEWQVLSDLASAEPPPEETEPPPPEWWDGLSKESERWTDTSMKNSSVGQSAPSGRRRGSPQSSGSSVPSLPLQSAGLPDGSLKSTDVCAFNAQAERRFVETLNAWLEQSGELERAFVRRNMAFSLDVSPRTVDRYIEKYCAAELSPWFELVNGVIRRKGA